MLKPFVTLFVLLSMLFGSLYYTNDMGLSVHLRRDLASTKATQTLGVLEVRNWWNHVVWTARTIEVAPSNKQLLNKGEYQLYLSNHEGQYATYGITGTWSTSKRRAFDICVANNVHNVDGNIGIGTNYEIQPKGAVFLANSADTQKHLMSLMGSKEEARFTVRTNGDPEPTFHVELPKISIFGMLWKFFKFLV